MSLTLAPLLIYVFALLSSLLSWWKAIALMEKTSHFWWVRIYAALGLLKPFYDKEGDLDVVFTNQDETQKRSSEDECLAAIWLLMYPVVYFLATMLVFKYTGFRYTALIVATFFCSAFLVRKSIQKFRSAITAHDQDPNAHKKEEGNA